MNRLRRLVAQELTRLKLEGQALAVLDEFCPETPFSPEGELGFRDHLLRVMKALLSLEPGSANRLMSLELVEE